MIDSTSKSHVILFIFFAEKMEHFLLVGRREKEKENDNSSSDSDRSGQSSRNKYTTKKSSKKIGAQFAIIQSKLE